MKRIYLDHAATSPLLPEAREAMARWLDAGNPSSLYEEGRQAKAAIDEARETLSSALDCLFAEVVFTSGATEAASMAIIGTAFANKDASRDRVLMGAAEHHCTLHTRDFLERLGYLVELIPVDREARIDLNALQAMLDKNVLLTCAMHANNELGSFSDIAAISELCRSAGSLLFVDAVQSFSAPTTMPDADLLSVSAHKIGGPKGAGALVVKAGTQLKPVIAGGGQERELRGGTENVAAIVGFAAAVRARRAPNQEARDLFATNIQPAGAIRSVVSGCLPGHLHVRFPGLDGETVVIRLDREGIAASSGAACSSGSTEASHVLLACGYSQKEAREGVRFTFGVSTSLADAEEGATRVCHVIDGLRKAKS